MFSNFDYSIMNFRIFFVEIVAIFLADTVVKHCYVYKLTSTVSKRQITLQQSALEFRLGNCMDGM
jgi:hypothetical protein